MKPRSLPALLCALALAIPAMRADGPAIAQQQFLNPSGLPLPRWVSVRADEANLRAGPGARYPIDWVLQRRNLPAEVVAEFENWRQIRIEDGTTGWIHKSMLSGKRTGSVAGDQVRILLRPDRRAPIAAFVDDGVVVSLESCEAVWCRVSIESHGVEGWIPRSAVWGLHDEEAVGR